MDIEAVLHDLTILVYPTYVLGDLSPLLFLRIPYRSDLVEIVSTIGVFHLQWYTSVFFLPVNQVPDPLFNDIWVKNTYIDLGNIIAISGIMANKQERMADYSLMICGV